MKELRRHTHASRRGNALFLALIAVLAVSAMAAAFLQLSLSATRRQAHSGDVKQAFYLAEAGLAEAYLGLSMAKTGNVGTTAEPAAYGDGAFWVEAEALEANRVQLASTGLWGSGRVTLGMVVEPAEVSVAALGVFSARNLKMNPETLVDSFDSSDGTYAEQVAAGRNNDRAVLGSNDDIALGTDSFFNGDVNPGPMHDVSIPASTTVTGNTSRRHAPEALPPIEVPDIPLGPAVHHAGAAPYVIPPGRSGFEDLRVDSDSELVIVGPAEIVVGSLYIEGRGHVLFDTTQGQIDLYVTEGIDMKSGSSATTPARQPLDVFVKVAAPSGSNVNFGAKCEFHGFIYAPYSLAKVAADFEIFGGLVADQFNLAARSRFHQDIAIARDARDRLPLLWSWRVVDVPDAVASSGRGPFETLGVDPAALPAPADAHQDQWLEVDYYDLSGALRSYSGWESGFDWSQVSAVIGGTRDGNRFIPVDPAPEPPPPAPAPAGTPMDWIEDPSHSSADLTRWLIDASPLTAGEINQAIARIPALENGDLLRLLDANQPLAAGTINLLLTTATPLTSTDVTSEMLRNTPMANGDLNTVINSAYLSDAEKATILIANSPLVVGVKGTLDAKDPPMNASDYDAVMAAQ